MSDAEMEQQEQSEQLPVDFKLDDADLIDVTEQKDRGCLKKILKEGTGSDTPFTGSKVTVHYVGRLLDENVFDSSRGRNEPFVFELGRRKSRHCLRSFVRLVVAVVLQAKSSKDGTQEWRP